MGDVPALLSARGRIVKALTVRQPWATAIADGHKLVENRSQGFPKRYRGDLAIHTARTWSERGRHDARILAAYGRSPSVLRDLGCVIAVVEVVDIHAACDCCAPWGEQSYPPANAEQRPPGVVTHIVMENVRKLARPLPARGALGLWTPDDDLALELSLVAS